MKVYLAGAVKDVPNFKEIFAEYAQKLRMEGHEVFNPAAANLEGMPFNRMFSYELCWLCEEAEAVAIIPGWQKSGGTNIELRIAKYLGKKVIWLRRKK